MISRDNYIPLYIQVKDEILSKIHDEVWKVEEKIPTEKELMKNYKVGRATIREAISMLVNEGYLEKRQGIGTFVCRRDPHLGFEPFISLALSLNIRGLKHNNKIIQNDKIKLSFEEQIDMKWHEDQAYYIERERFVEDKLIGIEKFYFDCEFQEEIQGENVADSLGKIIVEKLKVPIKRVIQDIIYRDSTMEEARRLGYSNKIKIMSMIRWIYIEGREEPFQYMELIIPSKIQKYFI
ncbi:GntR family transcriptional regulator [Oceanirhabdus sp. W0125-5]|uniref:GntR family transcriptional regulator n=1 Tax=Oceanirhabdus sp. W0125-5 TaxID=2999116 RepID=UPI0022F2B1D5|nr:GntR family transcriptional regulator [Oceanirhabdus sp. W0125-5]WBW97400.1 GntR family transcriptional regulator [Oceanirhabdus sp. W0125-5]